YLESLAMIPNANMTSEEELQCLAALQCVYQNDGRFRMGYEYPENFASPQAIAEIKDSNKSTMELCFRIVPGFLKSGSPRLRCEAARVLAYYSWPNSFEPLIRCEGSAEQKALLLGILGDKRGVPWVIKQYKLTDRHRGGKQPFSEYHSKMVYLNTLYHLASPQQLSFVNGIIASTKQAAIRSRAIKVRDRIYELNPGMNGRARSSAGKLSSRG